MTKLLQDLDKDQEDDHQCEQCKEYTSIPVDQERVILGRHCRHGCGEDIQRLLAIVFSFYARRFLHSIRSFFLPFFRKSPQDSLDSRLECATVRREQD